VARLTVFRQSVVVIEMAEPFVVTVVPTFQEADYIELCLRSLMVQTWPAEQHLIHVVDGGSDDGTREIVAALSKESGKNDGPEIMLLDNPGRYVAEARNLSLSHLPEEATHVLEMIGHVWVPSNHIEERMLDLDDLEQKPNVDAKKIAGIGTLVRESDQPIGMIGRWIEAVLQNPLASGRGQFAQFSGREKTTIPPFTLYHRAALEAVGGWNTDFITTQDSELNMRLSNEGWTLWRSNASYCRMAKRTSLHGWLLFGHRYGFWRTKHLLKTPERASLLEFLPWIGLLSTLALCYLDVGVMGYSAWFFPPIAYLLVLTLHGLLEALSRGQPTLLLGVPIMLVMLHISFSFGLLDGLLRKGRAPRDRTG
jgi:glycosyltransferase involved in cell wall biosynthesis